METVNHECYVSLEVAKLLKEAGFDWHTNLVYVDDKLLTNPYTEDWNNTIPDTYTSAPTLEVAQRWLREEKGMDVIIYVFGGSPDKTYTYEANTWTTWKNDMVVDKEYIGNSYTTYEGAQEAGIKKALEIILEKGE